MVPDVEPLYLFAELLYETGVEKARTLEDVIQRRTKLVYELDDDGRARLEAALERALALGRNGTGSELSRDDGMTGAMDRDVAAPLEFRNKAIGKVGLALAWIATAMIAVHAVGVVTFAVVTGHVWPLVYMEVPLVVIGLSMFNLSARHVTIRGDEVVVKKVFTTLRLRRGEMRAWSILNLLPTIIHAVRGGSGDKRIYFVRGPGPQLFAIGWWIEDYEQAVDLMTTDVKELSWLIH